ncbi:30S ribosomal protein S6 [Candidatus Microgenomates bacterium]|nr:30S ribosomal protein S6 [Candidatus Microgenomates bacterium]
MDYELVVLTRIDYGKKVADDVEKAVGGKSKITKTDDWGTKPLSYKILKQTEGAYFFFALTLEPVEVFPLDESLRRNENILRHLLVRSDKKKVAKVAHVPQVSRARKETKKVEKVVKSSKGKVSAKKGVKK